MRLIHKLGEMGEEVGQSLKSNIVTLDKREYKPKNADDDGDDNPEIDGSVSTQMIASVDP